MHMEEQKLSAGVTPQRFNTHVLRPWSHHICLPCWERTIHSRQVYTAFSTGELGIITGMGQDSYCRECSASSRGEHTVPQGPCATLSPSNTGPKQRGDPKTPQLSSKRAWWGLKASCTTGAFLPESGSGLHFQTHCWAERVSDPFLWNTGSELGTGIPKTADSPLQVSSQAAAQHLLNKSV